MRSVSERVDQLDVSIFDSIRSAWTSAEDLRSLLALHAALAKRGNFEYLEIGSYLGSSMQALVADSRCRMIVSIDLREAVSPDERSKPPEYAGNTTARMLAHLSKVPGANLAKITTLDARTDDLTPDEFAADLCFIDAEHTNSAVLRDARFCHRVIRGQGVIAFHDRTVVEMGIRRFLRELSNYRAYPLAHDVFVVEIGVPSLLSDPRVKAQVPRVAWLMVDRLRAMRLALAISGTMRSAMRSG